MISSNSVSAKIKPYNVQQIIFSCLRSKLAYENLDDLKKIYKKNGKRDFLSDKLLTTTTYNKVNKIFDNIIEDMNDDPIFYNGLLNKENKRDAQGYIIWKKNTIYITFRGTNDLSDIFDVIDIRPCKLKDDIIVHKGLYEQFSSIQKNINIDIINLLDSYPIERLIFSGHSAAAALSSLAALYFGKKYRNLHITNHIFASPLIGNINFIESYSNYIDESFRIEMEKDIVPMIPINPNFIHIPYGNKLKLNGKIEYNYESEFLSYNEILKTLITNYNEVVYHHSCEQYLEKLFNINYS